MKHFNETIHQIPKKIQDLTFLNEKGILVRLLKFPALSAKTESGLEIPRYDIYYNEAGNQRAKQNEQDHQSVGVVIAISATAEKFIRDNWGGLTLTPGAVIHVFPQAASPSNQYIVDRESPVPLPDTFILIHPQHIEALTPQSYELEFV